MDLADLYAANGKIESAKESLNKMVQFEPKLNAYGARYNYYKRKGKYEEAAEDFTTFNEIAGSLIENPKRNAKFLIARGDLYVLAEKYEKAIADYESAIAQDQEVVIEANERIILAKMKLKR